MTTQAGTITSQARRGVVSLLWRQAVLTPLSFGVSVWLARLLSPADFGGYATVAFLVMGLSGLFEGGLGAVLIQQPEEPSIAQMRTVFTTYLLVFSALAGVFWAGAPWMAVAFHLPYQGPWMLRVLSLIMPLGTLGAISTFLLERRMRFDVFARLDVLNLVIEKGVTLTCACHGLGAWSFVWGTLASVVVRMALLLRFSPWPIGLMLDTGLLRRVLSQGLYFQGLNLTYILRDNLITLIGGSRFGPQTVGYLNWGQNLPQTVSNPFIQIAARVGFPAFARLHDEPTERKRLLILTLQALNYATMPALALLAVCGSAIVSYVYHDAWRPGLVALDAFVVRMLLKNVTAILIEFLNARGRVKDVFHLTLGWTGCEIALALALVVPFGYNGIAYAYAVGPFAACVWLFAMLRAEVRLPLGRIVGRPLVGMAIAVAIAHGGLPFVTHSYTLFALMGAALAGALAFALLAERRTLLAAYRAWRAGRALTLETRIAAAPASERV